VKLLWLRLHNFRQFEGRTPRIEFAQGDRQNVTVIHGANGSGKTALLNAFTWLLYRKFTDAFGAPEQLVNRRAIAAAAPGDRVSAWVELSFEHNGRMYHLKRTKHVRRGNAPHEWVDEGEEVALESCGPDGQWQPVKETDIPDTLGRILPEQLLSYFFFDGERIERLQRPDKRSEITSATTMLIGELVLNRAIEHLNSAAKRLEKDLQKFTADPQAKALFDQLEELEQRKQEIEERQTQHEANLEGYHKQKRAIEESLLKSKGVRALQEQRDQLAQQEETLKQALVSTRNALVDLISSQGYQAFVSAPAKTFRGALDDLRNRGEIPSAIKEPFVRKLLEQQMCICGRPLFPGETPYIQVHAWMERAGISNIEEVALRMEGEVDRLERDIANLFAQLDRLQSQENLYRTNLSRLLDQLDAIREQLKASREENVRELQERLDEVNEGIESVLAQRSEDQRELNRLEAQMEHIRRRIEESEARTAQQQLAQRRLTACREAIRVLKEVRERQRLHFRTDLEKRVNRIFASISFKPYVVVLSDEYSLSLLDQPGGVPVGCSTGESQILSLSFIGAIIEQAREFTARRDRLPGPDSSTFPIVMDSPFGNLDPLYRQQVATRMPELANQVVIMVNRAQWEDHVEHAIYPRIGQEYVLSYFSPKADAEEDAIVRFGRKYDLVKRSSDDFERTQIVEVIR